MPTITVTEHQTLRCGQQGFTEQHWRYLLLYKEQQIGAIPVFQVLHRAVKFGQYVGVLQVKNLCIEILPKIYENADAVESRGILLQLLRKAKNTPLHALGTAQVDLGAGLLDLFIHHFLQSVRQLLHCGLKGAYHLQAGTLPYWRGRMDTPKQLRQSVIHKEKFHLIHQHYDYQHPAHQLIYAALQQLSALQTYSNWAGELEQILCDFPVQSPINSSFRVNASQFPHYYQTPLRWAEWIVHKTQPNFFAGEHTSLSILLDMNRLFEDYVSASLQSAVLGIATLRQQPSYPFWEEKRARPDMVLQYDDKTIVLDSKWKRLSQPSPADDDLRQLFAYQKLLNANTGVLIYPAFSHLPQHRSGHFHQQQQQETLLFFWDLHCEQSAQSLLALLSEGEAEPAALQLFTE